MFVDLVGVVIITLCYPPLVIGQRLLRWDAGVAAKLRHDPHFGDSAIRCGARAALPNRLSQWCHCEPGTVASPISDHPLGQRYCPSTERRLHFLRQGVGHCDCIDNTTAPRESTRPAHWSLPEAAAPCPHPCLPTTPHHRGWTELFTQNDYGWWETPVGKVEGHMTSRSVIFHNPHVLRCGDGKVRFEYTANPSVGVDHGESPWRQVPTHLEPLSIFGMHAAHSLVPRHVKWQPAAVTPSSPSSEPNPTVVVLLERRRYINHFHYGSVRWALHALALCTHAATLANLTLEQISCLPVATRSTPDSTTATPTGEYPQFLSFQRRIFGRAFDDECADLEKSRVLAITFGESADPLMNFPFGSARSVEGGALGAVSNVNKTRMTGCANGDVGAARGGWTPRLASQCHQLAKWHRSHGHSTDLPRFMGLRQPLAELRARVVGPEPVRPISRRVVLFQRNGCPFPKRFRRDNNMWKTRFAASQKHRCIINIDEVELSLQAAGFDVDVVDWGDHQYRDYGSVVQEMQNVSVFIGVEGSGSLHSLWMPAGRSGFLQLHPTRWEPSSYWGNGTIDLYTEAWVHYYGICVHDWPLPDIHATPIDAAALAGAVEQLHSRLMAGTCRTCLLEHRSGLCRKLDAFN
eukprot:m.332979 g.332979  ORF g.332979 m.332979 type:complete len:634 (-) comp27735_c1_seq1:2497-4398(-)